MSISAHLTPEPERRLWLIFVSMRRAAERTEAKAGALAAFAAVELGFLRFAAPPGPLSILAVVSLGASLPLGLLAFVPFPRPPSWLDFLGPSRDKTSVNDNLLSVDDLAKYTQNELINRLDRYLGGGVTATPYFEDIVGQIARAAVVAARQQRLLRLSCAAVGVGQLCLLAQLILR